MIGALLVGVSTGEEPAEAPSMPGQAPAAPSQVIWVPIPLPITGSVDTNVMQPLNNWLAYEEGDMRIRRILVKPMREKVISKANELTIQAETVKRTYDENLAAPLETAVTQRRALRETITQYRQQNQL